ncbi:cold shock domain-containing protein [bacterium]|nr:MAG: cold shock domain-containing protein [bacterium]
MTTPREGIVASYDKNKGYGIINTEFGEYCFSHKNIIMSGFRYLDPGDRVSFEVGIKGDKLQAVEVKLKP